MMMEEVDLGDTPLALFPQINIQDSVAFTEEDPPDPRIQVELERLNSSTDLINKLEVNLDEARMMFRQTLSESTQQIDIVTKKLGKCIDQARPYYEARIKAKQTLSEAQKSAIRYERAVSQHTAAREMVQLAEEGLLTRGCIFDATWQEMLNHATTKVNDAEKEKIESTAEHKEKFQNYHESETRVKYLQKELKRSIAKSSLNARRSLMQLSNIVRMQELQLLPYFELKAAINQRLEEHKRHVEDLENAVASAKSNYSQALSNLERISDQIHKTRQNGMNLGIRGTGVGAESPGPPHHSLNAKFQVINNICFDSLSEASCSKSSFYDAPLDKKWKDDCTILGLRGSTELSKKESNECVGEAVVEFGGAGNLENNQGADLNGWQFVGYPKPSSSCGSNLLVVDDKESVISDSESLNSMEMLSEEAIANLMLEDEINEATQLICSPLMDEYMTPHKSKSDLEIETKFADTGDLKEDFAAKETLLHKRSELSGNSSSDSGGTWEVVEDAQEPKQKLEQTRYDYKPVDSIEALESLPVSSTPPLNSTSDSTIKDHVTSEASSNVLTLSYSENTSASPTRPCTLPVSPVYSQSTGNVTSCKSDYSESSSPDNGISPAYAPLCDTPELLHRSVNI